MVVAVDVCDDVVRLWSRTADGITVERDHDYTPTCYAAGPNDALSDLRARLESDPKIVQMEWDRKYLSLRDDKRSRALAVSLDRPSEVATFAREVRTVHEPGDATGGSGSGRASGSGAVAKRPRVLERRSRESKATREPGGADQREGPPNERASGSGTTREPGGAERGEVPPNERTVSEANRELDGRPPGTFRLCNVDLSPKFRYCLETNTDPTPEAEEGGDHWPRALSLTLPTERQAAGDLTALTCEEAELEENDEAATLRALAARLDEVDPDVLVLSSADLVPLIHDRADALGVDCDLGRMEGHRRLAGENSYESYGRIGYSPARYDIPGRAIVDRSNSFFWHEGKLPGLFDLVERSWKPLQEASWASIGTVFTAMQIQRACERDVLVPWRAWTAEQFTTARTLHDADRGGFTFEPEVGMHEAVVEIDFASLYPRIMIENDLSPETVRCDCHDTDDVPKLGYSVCPDVDDPFVPSVLRDIVDDRYGFKAERRSTDDPERADRLESKISALKWILVTCFGYQGYRNSKFGRIEVHESINAHARELLLEAKAELEASGWRVVHGIVDSLWVKPENDLELLPESGTDPIEDVCERVTDETGIPLEHESDFEWVCFVPTTDGKRGSLTSYFGKREGRAERGPPNERAGAEGFDRSENPASKERHASRAPDQREGAERASGDGGAANSADGDYKFRGIEARQHSTPTFVDEVQQDLVEALDRHREPDPVCNRLARAIARLHSGSVDPQDLVIRTSASKPLADYDQRTRTVAALKRYEAHGVDRHPGQDVRYVVVDDGRRDRERVRLPWEDCRNYDADFYETLLVRAAESVVSPLGWDRDRIRRYLDDGRDLSLSAFG